jgi:hypothetical protein
MPLAHTHSQFHFPALCRMTEERVLPCNALDVELAVEVRLQRQQQRQHTRRGGVLRQFGLRVQKVGPFGAVRAEHALLRRRQRQQVALHATPSSSL